MWGEVGETVVTYIFVRYFCALYKHVDFARSSLVILRANLLKKITYGRMRRRIGHANALLPQNLRSAAPRSRPACDERGIFLEALKRLQEDARGALLSTSPSRGRMGGADGRP